MLPMHEAPTRRTLARVLTAGPVAVGVHCDMVGLVLPHILGHYPRTSEQVSTNPLDALHILDARRAHLPAAFFGCKLKIAPILRKEIDTSHKPSEQGGLSRTQQMLARVIRHLLINCVNVHFDINISGPLEGSTNSPVSLIPAITEIQLLDEFACRGSRNPLSKSQPIWCWHPLCLDEPLTPGPP